MKLAIAKKKTELEAEQEDHAATKEHLNRANYKIK